MQHTTIIMATKYSHFFGCAEEEYFANIQKDVGFYFCLEIS